MCVVVPARSPIDKLVAYKRVELDFGERYRLEVQFCDVNMPSPEHYEKWESLCSPGVKPYLIDVGNKKYHKSAGSAAEVEKMASDTTTGRAYNQLVELVNKNNQTGFLKNARHSVAKILRDAYHVMNSGEVSQEVVFDHGMDVVNAWFLNGSKRKLEDLFTDPQFSALRDLWNGFKVSEKEVLPFTLPMYFRQLFMSGRSSAEIMEKVGWWLDKVKRIAERRDAARAWASKLSYEEVRSFSVQGKRGGLVTVVGYFQGEAFLYEWVGSGKLAIAIMRNERDQAHIQSSFRHKGAEFKALVERLESDEPGRWYHETRFQSPMLMNGSRQFMGIAPTDKTDDELIELVCTLVKFEQPVTAK